jgi:hypothetical protein
MGQALPRKLESTPCFPCPFLPLIYQRSPHLPLHIGTYLAIFEGDKDPEAVGWGQSFSHHWALESSSSLGTVWVSDYPGVSGGVWRM